MNSRKRSPLADFELDIPTTEEDIAALRRAAAIPVEDPFAAIQRLNDALPPKARSQSRKTHKGWADFEL